jgi:hypothetical protein
MQILPVRDLQEDRVVEIYLFRVLTSLPSGGEWLDLSRTPLSQATTE